MRKLLWSVLAITCSHCLAASSNPISVQPLSYDFGKQFLNKSYQSTTFTLKNTGTVNVSLESYVLSGPFQWSSGLVPQRLPPGAISTLTVRFWPTVAGPASGSLVLMFKQGLPNITLPLSGTGQTTTAAISYSAQELMFPNTPVGTSASQNLTLTNPGQTNLSVTQALVTPNTFSLGGQSFPFTLGAGKSTTVVVTYAPVTPGTEKGSVSFIYGSLPFSGVGISGMATAPSALTVATITPIPGMATQGALYNYVLSAGGGSPPYSWSMTGGSLPSGLTMNSQGVISGTVSRSATGQMFLAQVTDSSSNVASEWINLQVESPTGSSCNNITWNITGTNNPEIPMDQLGTGTYLGVMGGLYPGGSNIMPAAHQTSGINIANSIQPLDANGNPDPNGKYALMAMGTSDANYEFNRFIEYATKEPTVNPHLALVQGAMGGEGLDTLLGPQADDFWNNIYGWSLPIAGVTPMQVVAIWLEPEDAHPPGGFPLDMNQMHTELRTLIPNLLVRFPNLKLLYLSSRTYAGYSNPPKVTTEPYAYDQGFALQAVIADQINGDPALNFDPAQGPVVAPWIAWENYKWGNGMNPHNGMVWACGDFRSDGYHVAASGEDKFSGLLMNFLKSDPTASPWFYVPSPGGKH